MTTYRKLTSSKVAAVSFTVVSALAITAAMGATVAAVGAVTGDKTRNEVLPYGQASSALSMK